MQKAMQYLEILKRRLWSDNEIDLYIREANLPPLEFPCKGEFRQVDTDNIRDSQRFEDVRYMGVYEQMLREGQWGLFGYLDGKCVSRSWMQLEGDVVFCGLPVMELKPDEAYCHYFYTDPVARGKGMQTKAIELSVRQFESKRLYTLVESDNATSWENFRRNGFSRTGTVSVKFRFGIPTVHVTQNEAAGRK